MDKYLLKIKKLEQELQKLNECKKKLADELMNLNVDVASLTSKNIIDQNKIKINSESINQKNNSYNFYRNNFKSYAKIFTILYLLITTILIFSSPVISGLLLKLIISFGFCFSLVGGAFVFSKKQNDKYYEKIDIPSLVMENLDLKDMIESRNLEKSKMTSLIENLNLELANIENNIVNKTAELDKITGIRNAFK